MSTSKKKASKKAARKPRAKAPKGEVRKRKGKATKAPRAPRASKAAKAPKAPRATKPRAQRDGKPETSSSIVRRLFAAKPEARFSEILTAAEAAGVKRTTAAGILVREKKKASEAAA